MALGLGTDFRFDIFARDRSSPAWRGVENSVQRAQRSVQAFMRAAGPLLGLSGAVSAGALALATREALEYADALVQAADRTSFAVDELEALRYAGRLNRVEFNQTDMAMQRFSRRLAEAANGSGELKNDLSNLGIELRDNEGRMRSSYDILLDYADAVKNTEDGQEQLRLAFKAFDSEGAALVTVLSRGRDGLEAYAEQARAAGAIMGDELARNAAAAATAFERMRVNFEANRNRAVAEQAENLEALADQLTRIVELGFQAAGAMGAFFASLQAEDGLLSRIFGTAGLSSGDDPRQMADTYAAALGDFRNQVSGGVALGPNDVRAILQRSGLSRIEADSFLDAFGGETRLPFGAGGYTDQSLARLENAMSMAISRAAERALMAPANGGRVPGPTLPSPPRRGGQPFGPLDLTGGEVVARVNAKGASAAGVEDLAAQKAKFEIDAQVSALEENRERFVSEFAFTFASGVRAAFNGGLADFAAQRLQEALYNRLYDLFADLGEQLFNAAQGGAGGGGLGGLIAQGAGFLFGGGGGANPAPAAFGGGKAAGGPVQPGKFYAWQEQGREFFSPTVPGEIIPQGSGARRPANMTVNQTFNVDARGAVSAEEVERRVRIAAQQAKTDGAKEALRRMPAEMQKNQALRG